MVSIEHIESPAFLVDVLPDGAFVYRDGNSPLERRTGLGQRLRKGLSPQELLPAPLAATVIGHYRACVRSVAVLAFEERLDAEGVSSHWRTTLIPLHDAGSGRVATLLGIMVDITHSKRAELELLRANMQLSLALQAVQGAHWSYGVQAHSFEASPNFALLLGEDGPRRVTLDEWVRHILPADRRHASFHTLVEGVHPEMETRFRIRTRTGEERWLKCRRLAARDAAGAVQVVFGVTVDVTDETRKEEQLVRDARQDGLTRLLNRRGFLDRLAAMVGESEADGAPLGVLMLDLDDFKGINDTLGHAAGDLVLATVGQRIEQVLRPTDCAARLGGDEFAIAVAGRDGVRTRQLVDRLRRALQQPCPTRDADIPVGVSIGEACWQPGQGVAEVVDAADRALYAEKRHKRSVRHRGQVLPLRLTA